MNDNFTVKLAKVQNGHKKEISVLESYSELLVRITVFFF